MPPPHFGPEPQTRGYKIPNLDGNHMHAFSEDGLMDIITMFAFAVFFSNTYGSRKEDFLRFKSF